MSKNSFASSCNDYKIKIVYNKKDQLSKEKMCTFIDEDKTLYYMSESCLFYGCSVLKKKKENLVIPDYHSKIGSPGFKLCLELGGLPQILEFSLPSDNGHWQSTERCLLNEKDFIEISFLTKEWKNLVKIK